MKQNPSDLVDQFAFKYKNILYKLDKLGESINKPCPTYVTSQFISKLRPHIAQHLVLPVDQVIQLDKAIEAAHRIKQSFITSAKQEPASTSQQISPSPSFLCDGTPSRSALVVSSNQINQQHPLTSCCICGHI